MKRFSQSLSIVLLCGLVFSLSCQREVTTKPAGSSFDAAAAKEWYYGVFKKTDEWAMSPQVGKKLPDWQHPVVGKIAGHEVVEFPLIEAHKTFALPSSFNAADRQKMAGASISKIQFIKGNSPSDIRVREVDYIPDFEYVQKKGFDISDQSMLNGNGDFTGTVVVKKWNGTANGIAMFKNGRFERRGTIIKGGTGNRPHTETCTVTEFCIIQQDCTLYIYGDGMTTNECGDWYNTGECWQVENCSGSEGDICELLNIGCDNDGGNNGGIGMTCEQMAEQLDGNSVSELENTTLVNETAETRTKLYDWTIYRQNMGLWKFTSHETGVHVKVNNVWKWQSFTHDNISRSGTMIGGSVNCTLNTATPYLGQFWASMTLNYNIEASLVCGGSPFNNSADHSSTLIRNVNE